MSPGNTQSRLTKEKARGSETTFIEQSIDHYTTVVNIS